MSIIISNQNMIFHNENMIVNNIKYYNQKIYLFRFKPFNILFRLNVAGEDFALDLM